MCPADCFWEGSLGEVGRGFCLALKSGYKWKNKKTSRQRAELGQNRGNRQGQVGSDGEAGAVSGRRGPFSKALMA